MCMAAQATPSSAATAPLRGADVVEQRGPGGDRGPGHRGLAGVDRDPGAVGGQRLDHGDDPPQLLGLGDGAAPGRVDSPPTSSQSAPSASRARPWAMAAAWSSNCPPSENESGVTLMTPITSGRGWGTSAV